MFNDETYDRFHENIAQKLPPILVSILYTQLLTKYFSKSAFILPSVV